MSTPDLLVIETHEFVESGWEGDPFCLDCGGPVDCITHNHWEAEELKRNNEEYEQYMRELWALPR